MTPTQLLNALGLDPNPTTHAAYLDNWLKVKDTAKALTAIEMTMRRALFDATFPAPNEGTNTFVMADGRKLVATHKISRSIDIAQIAPTRAEYALLNERPVEFDDLLKTEYSLVTSAFRKLEPAAGQAPGLPYLTVARMITAKPGAPSLEVK